MPPRTPPVYRGKCKRCDATIVRTKADASITQCDACTALARRAREHAIRRRKRAAAPKRYVGNCRVCGIEVVRFKSDGNVELCNRCRDRELAAKALILNPRRNTEAGRRWRAKNPARAKELPRLWALKNPDRRKKIAMDYFRRHRDAYAARRKRRGLAIPKWADMLAIRAFYREAQRLTRETGVVHEVDHIIPVCGRLVTGLHVPENLQILTLPENRSKHARFSVD